MTDVAPLARAPPTQDALAAVADLRFDALVELLDLLVSCATSAREAAWRRERGTLDMHVKQARLVLIEALATFRELGAEIPAP